MPAKGPMLRTTWSVEVSTTARDARGTLGLDVRVAAGGADVGVVRLGRDGQERDLAPVRRVDDALEAGVFVLVGGYEELLAVGSDVATVDAGAVVAVPEDRVAQQVHTDDVSPGAAHVREEGAVRLRVGAEATQVDGVPPQCEVSDGLDPAVPGVDVVDADGAVEQGSVDESAGDAAVAAPSLARAALGTLRSAGCRCVVARAAARAPPRGGARSRAQPTQPARPATVAPTRTLATRSSLKGPGRDHHRHDERDEAGRYEQHAEARVAAVHRDAAQEEAPCDEHERSRQQARGERARARRARP